MATAIERLNALKGNMTAAPVRTDPMGRLNALKGIMKPAATYTPPKIEKPAQIPTAYGFGAAAIGNIHEPIITSQRESQERLASYDVKQGKYSLKALEAQKAQAKTRMEDAQTAQLAAMGDANTRIKAQNAYETYKKIYDDLSAKELQSRQDLAAAEHFQTTQMYNRLTAQPDFQSFSNRGASIDSVVSRPATTTLSGNRSDTHARYSFMSDDEVDIYTYLLAKKGKDAAQEYLNHLEETLNYRQGSASADVVLGSPGRAFNAGMFGIGAGFDQFASGAKQLFSKDRLPTSAMQFGSAKVREGLGGPKLPDWMGGGTLGQAAYDVTTTTANMAPSILLSTITAGLGAPAAIASGVAAGTLGASASGNAYNQALQEGYTEKQARNYSALVGASEGALQYLLGGIGALGGKFLSGSLKTAISNIDSAILRVGATLALDMTSEGTEEYLQEILDPVFRNLMLGENNEVKLFTPEAAYSYILGAITAGFIEGGNTISNSVKLNNLGESIQKAGNYAALLDGALALKVDLASKLSNGDIKPTNQNIGELFAEYVKKGGKADVLAPQSETPAETPTPPQAVPTTTPQAAPVLQPVTNSEAERILADPEALSKLGVVITPVMTKSQQRAAVKAAMTTPQSAPISNETAEGGIVTTPQINAVETPQNGATTRITLLKPDASKAIIRPEIQLEDELTRLREETAEIEEQINAPFSTLSPAETVKLKNRLTKLYAEIDKLTLQEERAAVKTSYQTILQNLSKYRRSDLESLAEQISDGNWDGYEDLSREELESALEEAINERSNDMTALEMQTNKYGLFVRPVKSVGQLTRLPHPTVALTSPAQDATPAVIPQPQTAPTAPSQPVQAASTAAGVTAPTVSKAVESTPATISGYHTPVTAGKESVSALQSAGLPSGYYIALDKPFESNVHDAKKAVNVQVDVNNVYDPNGVMGTPTANYQGEMVDYLNTLTDKSPQSESKAMADFLTKKGFDAYARNIDGQEGNRELIVFDKSKVTETPQTAPQPVQAVSAPVGVDATAARSAAEAKPVEPQGARTGVKANNVYFTRNARMIQTKTPIRQTERNANGIIYVFSEEPLYASEISKWGLTPIYQQPIGGKVNTERRNDGAPISNETAEGGIVTTPQINAVETPQTAPQPVQAVSTAAGVAAPVSAAAGNPVLKLPTIESRRVSENATTSRPADWTADRVGDAKDTMSISDIVNKIRHDFDVQVTTGYVRGAEGQFNTQTKGIRTKTANDLPTLSHELGHRLDNKYGLRNAPANIQKELIDNLPPDVKGPKLAEGIAEYIRAYLQNSETAAIDYPLFTEYFRKALSESDLELVNSAADEVNAYFSLDVDTAASSIKLKEDKPIDFRSNEEKLKDFGDDFYQNWMDALHGIKMFDKATGANTYKIASNSAYSDAVAYAILTGDLTDINGQPVGEGLLAAIKNINTKNKAEYRAFGEYLAMKHGVEYLQEGKRVFADDRKNSTSFMKKRAAELEKQYPKFKESAEKLYKFQREFLTTYGVELGLVTKESAESWFKDRPFYVPFNRALTKQGQGVKRGFANQSSTIKKAIGSGLDLVHPVDNIVANIVRMVNAAYKNHVMQQITDAAATLEDTAKFLEKVTSTKVTTLKLQGVKDSISKSVGEAVLAGELDDSAAGFMDDLLDGMDDVLKQYGQGKAFGDVVTVLKKGKPEFWKINDPYLLESVTNMNPTRLPAFLNAYGRVSKLMTSAITGTNVVWSIFSNFPRDMQTYFTYSQDKNLINMVGGIFSAYANKVKGNKADPIYKEYLAMGGGRTSAYSADKNLAKTVRGKVRGSKLKWLNPLEWIDFVSDTIELGPRFSYYKMLRSKGFSPQEAFYESTDITVNFRRGGTQARVANKFIPFFNAGVQGLDKFARWVTANEAPQGSRSKAVRNRAVGFITASAVIAVLKYALNSLDDDRKKAYAQLSNFTKNNYWCFPMKDGKFFAVPKPREIGVLSSLFEALMEQFGNNNPHAMDDMYGYFADVTLPNAVGDVMQGDWRGAVGSLGIIGVAANMMANRDFLGKPILSESMQSLEPKDQYTQRTSKIAYWMGKAFNVSPQMTDYFFSQVLGGWWKYQKALFPVGSEEVDLTLGVQNQYVKDNQYSTDLLNRMYDSLEKAEKAKNSNPDDTEKAINYKWYSNIATFYSRFNKLSKNLPETTSNRATRQEVLNLIIEFEKDMENGYKTSAQKAVEEYCLGEGSTELMPSVMNSVIKSEDESYTLDAKQYLKYQSEYLTLYWDYVESALSRSKYDVGEVLKEAKSAAASTAKANALKRLGVTTENFTEAQETKAAGVTPWQEILFHSAIDPLKSDKDADGNMILSKQDKVLAAMKEMSWLTEPQKAYLYSTIYSSDYPGG